MFDPTAFNLHMSAYLLIGEKYLEIFRVLCALMILFLFLIVGVRARPGAWRQGWAPAYH